jgi:Tol biopolymer transport system component
VVYLIEDGNDNRQLFVMGALEKNPTQLTRAEKGVVDYALSPDASRIAYIEQTEDVEYNIWMMNADGAENTLIVDCEDAACSQPVWSPDGKRIMYEYMPMSEDGYGTSSLWWYDVSASRAQPVFQESRLPGTNPRWSPDGAWMSYAEPEGLRLYHFETGESRLIKNALGAAVEWSPDGKFILLRDVVIKDGKFITQLFVYGVDSQKTANLNANENVENILAAWSPDGKQIAVVRRDLTVLRGDQIWVMRADGSSARALTESPATLHGSFNWSPDGRYLLYDLYLLDSFPLESRLEMVDMQTGELTTLRAGGYTPKWIWSK